MSQLARAMTEDQLLTAITEAATFLGWRWHHVRRSDKALQMGHSGFPDLVLARAGSLLFLELKREGKWAEPAQMAWINAINGPHDTLTLGAYIVTPSMLDTVLKWLE